jgi:hypothetical protein
MRRPAQRGVNAQPCRALSAIGAHLKIVFLKVDRALRARYSQSRTAAVPNLTAGISECGAQFQLGVLRMSRTDIRLNLLTN